MLRKLVDFSLDHRFLVFVAWALVAAWGVRSLLDLPIDAVPDVTNVQVQILTQSPGLAPEEVEQFVTFPVEAALGGLPRVEEIRSLSKFGLSVITVVFEEGVDIYWARQLVNERVGVATKDIPEGFGEPTLGPIATGLGEIYQFELRGDPLCAENEANTAECYTPMELRTLLDWTVAPLLRAVPGVVEVNSLGGELQTFQVTLDPDRLAAYRLSVGDVIEALERNHRNVGGGFLERGDEQVVVRGEGLIRTLDDLERVVLAHGEDGTPVTVAQVGRAETAPRIRQGAATRDGEGEVVVGIVMMLLGENSRVVVDRVKERVETIRDTLPPGVTIEPFYDRTDLVRRTMRTVARNLAEGGLLVIVVLLLLLGSLRGGLLVASTIPLSMLAAFIGMRLAGLSGNLMSLGAIDFGLIVDGSVVMVENIVRRLHADRDGPDTPGTRLETIRAAAHEVARPVTFAVGILLFVYLPVLALRGIEGKMFRPMALTVLFAIAASLVCALTLMPALSSLVLGRGSEREPRLFALARRAYRPALDRVLAHPRSTAGVAVTVFVSSLLLVPLLGAEFVPRLDEGAIAVQIQRLPSISLEASNRLSTLAEKVIREEFPEVETAVSRTGRPEIATDPMGVELSDTYLMLAPRETWRFDTKEELVSAIAETLEARVPGARFAFSQPIELRVAELVSGTRSDLALHLYGDDLELLEEKANELAAALRAVPGAADVRAEQSRGLPMLRVRVDREAIARYGIDADDVLDVVATLGGRRVGVVVDGLERFDLQVRFDRSVRDDLERLRDLRVAAPEADRSIPLSQLADITLESGAAQIQHDAISRRITVEANVRGRDLASFVADARETVAQRVELPVGWRIEWGGQFENLASASRRLGFLVALALLVIFALLHTAFGSARRAALVFCNVPLAITGGLVALWLRGYPFSISAGVGFLALCGVAVLNGVVLVTYVEERRRGGFGPVEAAREGALVRLRPVLMTALVASLGFVPMALATSAGAEVQRPLATVVIGGLCTATLLTLLVVPAVYRWFAADRAETT